MAKKEVKSNATKTIDLLLENTIDLQKTLTSLAAELKTLNKKVSDLFQLFEEASSSFKEAGAAVAEAPGAVPQELLDKIDALVEQNRTIAKGLLLLEKALREKETKETEIFRPTKTARPLRKKPAPEEAEAEVETEVTEAETEEYKPQPLPEFSF